MEFLENMKKSLRPSIKIFVGFVIKINRSNKFPIV